jgi:hypothetical protein
MEKIKPFFFGSERLSHFIRGLIYTNLYLKYQICITKIFDSNSFWTPSKTNYSRKSKYDFLWNQSLAGFTYFEFELWIIETPFSKNG